MAVESLLPEMNDEEAEVLHNLLQFGDFCLHMRRHRRKSNYMNIIELAPHMGQQVASRIRPVAYSAL